VDDFKYILRAELLQHSEILRNSSISSVFFGGGTPTILKAEDICFIIQEIDNISSGILKGAEITVETNPCIRFESRLDYLRTIKAGGVNRISVGVQSFDNSVLRTLERSQKSHDVREICEEIKQLGMMVSLDLIYGTPTESLESWETSVRAAVDLNPNHLSIYALTLDNTVRLAKQIKRGKLKHVDDDILAQKYELADEILQNSGYAWYEVSNWEKLTEKVGENQSVHNLNYWKNGEYIGIGPSAHSSIRVNSTLGEGNSTISQKRFWNTSSVDEYVEQVRNLRTPVEEEEVLTLQEELYEKAMLTARLNVPIANCTHNALEKLISLGLINPSDLTPTLKGRLLNDEIIRILVEYELQNTSFVHNLAKSCPKYNTSQCLSCPQCIME
jgi:oxygen-independent coproporphyrinogen-3 oxidase